MCTVQWSNTLYEVNYSFLVLGSGYKRENVAKRAIEK